MPFTLKAYWQQHVATTIKVRLDDRAHVLRAFEELVYTNNSPDTLQKLIFHIWPNAYKDDKSEFCKQQVLNRKKSFYFSKPQDKGFIDSLQFVIDGELHDYDFYKDHQDIIEIPLLKPLAPGQKISISTPFRVKLPKVFSRLGHTNEAYFISQWFPKPAVYDAQGWHPIPYLDQGEFYSEFGSYDVEITLHKNYVLLATGDCMTAAEQAFMDSLAQVPIAVDSLLNNDMPVSSNNYKTVRFFQDNVHDFAWFADKRYILRKDSVILDKTEQKVYTYTAFLPKSYKYWKNAHAALRATLQYYGAHVGAYPYTTLKAVEGDMHAGGGMEYPTITVIDKGANSDLARVLIHEAGHNWFYGILGTNERRNPWMDEGFNSFYENKTHQFYQDSLKKNYTYVPGMDKIVCLQQQATGIDQCVLLKADSFTMNNYLGDVYVKTPMLLAYLEQYLGADTFKYAMQQYYDTWKFKHPQPNDFRAIIEQSSSKNTDWFFDTLLHSHQAIDFKITHVGKVKDSLVLHLKNKSQLSLPAVVSLNKSQGETKTYYFGNFKGKMQVTVPYDTSIKSIILEPKALDFTADNNQYFMDQTGQNAFQIGLGFGLNTHNRNKSWLAPALGYNYYDGFGLGLLYHNLSIPQKRFQWAVSPLYGFKSKHVNFVGATAYAWYPKTVFQKIETQLNYKSFSMLKNNLNIPKMLYAQYFKLSPQIQFLFKEKDPHSKVQNSIQLKYYHIGEEAFKFKQNLAIDSLFRPELYKTTQHYWSLDFSHKNLRTFHPFQYNAQIIANTAFTKLSADASIRIDYDVPKKSLYLRAFAAQYWTLNTSKVDSRTFLNGTYQGENDYLYDGTYIARNENTGLGARQISMQDAAMKIPTLMYINPLGRSDNRMLAINVKTDLPLINWPIRFFADFMTFTDAKKLNPSGTGYLFDAGLQLDLFSNMLSIYFPFIMSQDYKDYQKSMYPKANLLNQISFSINLQKFNFLNTPQVLYNNIIQ